MFVTIQPFDVLLKSSTMHEAPCVNRKLKHNSQTLIFVAKLYFFPVPFKKKMFNWGFKRFDFGEENPQAFPSVLLDLTHFITTREQSFL